MSTVGRVKEGVADFFEKKNVQKLMKTFTTEENHEAKVSKARDISNFVLKACLEKNTTAVHGLVDLGSLSAVLWLANAPPVSQQLIAWTTLAHFALFQGESSTINFGANGIYWLLALAKCEQRDKRVLGVSALAHLAFLHDEYRQKIREAGGLAYLIALCMNEESADVRRHAISAVGNMAFEEASQAVIEQQGVADTLHDLRRQPNCDPQTKPVVLRALAALGEERPLKNSRGVRILTMDGGGVRALLTLEMLKALRDRTGLEIHEMFDLIGGSSTGGILAFALCLRHKSLEECEQMYKTLSAKVFFNNPVVNTVKMISTKAYYNDAVLEKIFERELSNEFLIDNGIHEDTNKVFAVASHSNRLPTAPFLFRNYCYPRGHRSRYPGSCTHKIWQAVRATTAALSYFSEYLDSGGNAYQDGGVVANNPSAIAVHEAQCLWPSKPIDLVVSLGTGRFFPSNARTGGWIDTAKVLIQAATNTEAIHEVLEDVLPSSSYIRLNPSIPDVVLDEYRPERLQALQEIAYKYVQDNDEVFTRVAAQLKQKDAPERAWGSAVKRWFWPSSKL